MGGRETHADVEMVVAEVAARVRRLHDHLLALHGPAREGQLVAGAAPAALGAAGDVHGRVAVGQVVGHGPRALVGAHEGRPAVAGALGVGAAERVVVLVAGEHGAGAQRRLVGPGAGRLAAVPVAGRGAAAGGGHGGQGEEEGEEGEEGGF